MEHLSRYSRVSQQQMKQRRSGYEPSDTETDWYDSPRHEYNRKNAVLGGIDQLSKGVTRRNTSPMTLNWRHPSPKRDLAASPPRRRHSKSPYKPPREDGNALSPKPASDARRNVSPFSNLERRRHVSPYKIRREETKLADDEMVSSNRKQDRTPTRGERGADSQFHEDRITQKSNFSRRSVTAPRSRGRDDLQKTSSHTEQRRERTPSPLPTSVIGKQKENGHLKSPTVGEINELVANTKLSKGPPKKAPVFESTDSISPGDIFFPRDCTALPKNGTHENRFTPDPQTLLQNGTIHQQKKRSNDRFGANTKVISSNTGFSRTTATPSSALNGQQSSDKNGTGSSHVSDASGRTTDSMRKFTANRQKSQTEPWFACMRRSCRTTKSPERTTFNETTYIEKAIVVESLRQFWADKYQPGSLNGFTCHKQETQLLKQLVSQDIFPHLLFKGPAGSGKRALSMALLQEVYGDSSLNISHDLRYFQIQEKRMAQVAVPLASSAHHMELNVKLEPNAKYALMALVKEISSNYAMIPEVSTNFKADCKVMVLYGVDKAAENIQHLIKWIMDCYTDACILILCCEEDVDILDSVKSRCKVIKVDPPATHEIIEVLIQIAKKEDFDLPTNFAAKIATKSKQNLRKAIMALEACKANKYPFLADQPIPFGWEEVLVELAAEILADPSTNRLFLVRGKFQKLLVEFVHPKLILQKLVEEFLKGVDTRLKRELYYWHAYYEKRLPTGMSALLKLEEFVAKFMSICRKASGNC